MSAQQQPCSVRDNSASIVTQRTTAHVTEGRSEIVDQERPREEQPSFDWELWIKWVLVSLLGWAIGWAFLPAVAIGIVVGLLQWLVLRSLFRQAGWWVLLSAAGWATGYAVFEALQLDIIVFQGMMIGTVMGLVQWSVLRQWVHRASWWIPISGLGWAVGPILSPLLTGAVVGAVTGFALEMLLRHQHEEV